MRRFVIGASALVACEAEPPEDNCTPGTPVEEPGSTTSLGEGNFEDALPFVVSTVPQSGDGKVDPATDQIRVRFSEPMDMYGWSWAQRDGELFPEFGEAFFLDDQTAVLDVTLEPRKTYEIWINGFDTGNFRSAAGEEVAPFTLVFRTRAAD